MKLSLLGLCMTTVFTCYATGFTSVSNAQQQTQNYSQSNDNIALAKHLHSIGAIMYGAYWCPYCEKQRKMFGQAAFAQIKYIECDPRSTSSRPDLCRKARVRSYPTWEINGRMYPGMRYLTDLANLSDFKGN